MTTASRVIKFLENDDLLQLLLTLTQEQVKNQSLQLNNPKNAAKQTRVSTYQSLASEYTQFLDSEYLDNIVLKINGTDGTPFSSTGGKLLIAEASRRLESPLFGSRLGLHECESELNVLWFPPVPINIKNLGQEN
ncbi:hypothetical protein [Paenibacillus sp. Marseille-Q4541]|uniref:hypothetical protein n=1 Tax=Paenibacillus sp. Marseille-Q4541 TaxID=2831522 RepID=UPI001BAADC83|nr:hypothetical protein [Paenibacillus sp. Marseille-Q4541]